MRLGTSDKVEPSLPLRCSGDKMHPELPAHPLDHVCLLGESRRLGGFNSVMQHVCADVGMGDSLTWFPQDLGHYTLASLHYTTMKMGYC